ncbi:MAG TPA: oligosaccharide flippase family protein [Candidatus Dormibacteraeota bacterium]|nr:oligosaccharide flippase family protein [Candidatus Dormibacteraeota bacterium]
MPTDHPASPLQLARRFRQDPLLRNSAIYLTGGLLAGLFGYVFHFVTGRLLGPAGYSVVAAAIAALSLVTLPSVVLQLVSARYTSVAAATGKLAGLPPLLLRISGVTLLFGVPLMLLLAAFAPAAARFFNIPDTRVVYVLAMGGIVSLLVTITRGALQGLRRFFALSGNALVDAVSRVLLAGAFVAAGFGILGAVAALMLSPLIAYLQSLYLLRHLGAIGGNRERADGLGRYALLAATAGIGVTYLFTVDTLLAKHYLDATEAGIYAAASVLGRVVYFLGLTVAGVMFPEVATLHARNEAHFHVVDRSFLLVSAMGVLLVIAYAAMPGLVLLPYGSSFTPVRPYLTVFAVALTLLALSNLVINYFLSVARSGFVVPLFAACVLETVLIVLFHSGIWQIIAMVMVSLGALLAATLLLYCGDRLGWRPAPG